MIQLCSSTETSTACKNFCFIQSEKPDFNIVYSLSIVVYALPMHMLTSLSVDEILLARYVNWSTYFRGLPLDEEMAPSCLKHMKSILSKFT